MTFTHADTILVSINIQNEAFWMPTDACWYLETMKSNSVPSPTRNVPVQSTGIANCFSVKQQNDKKEGEKNTTWIVLQYDGGQLQLSACLCLYI